VPRLRHIALIVTDPDATARFFADAFGMIRVADIPAGCHMSDGTVSVALLRKDSEDERVGIDHFGFLVDEIEAASQVVLDAGGEVVLSGPSGGHAAFERKFRTPDGIVFDLSLEGWPGSASG